MNIEDVKIFAAIQSELNAPKNQYNNFGKYHYRNLEDICSALKPLLEANNAALYISDEIEVVGDRYYVKATSMLIINDSVFQNTAYAREEESKKGMDGSQITGSSSSYARKYSLNGLFLIDDTKDADSMDNSPSYNDKQKSHFDSLLQTGDYFAFYAFIKTLSQDVYTDLYNSGEKGKKTLVKNQAKELESAGAKQWSAFVDQIVSDINESDSSTLAESISELDKFEKKYLSERLGPKLSQDLAQLIKGEA